MRVTEIWTTSYSVPVRVIAGDTLRLTVLRDEWQGHCWLCAVVPQGRTGWAPDDLAEKTNTARANHWRRT